MMAWWCEEQERTWHGCERGNDGQVVRRMRGCGQVVAAWRQGGQVASRRHGGGAAGWSVGGVRLVEEEGATPASRVPGHECCVWRRQAPRVASHRPRPDREKKKATRKTILK